MYKFYHKISHGATVWHFNQPKYLHLEYFFNEFLCNQIFGQEGRAPEDSQHPQKKKSPEKEDSQHPQKKKSPENDENKQNQKVLMMVYVTGHGYTERNPNAADF